jgi:hypothetical protein
VRGLPEALPHDAERALVDVDLLRRRQRRCRDGGAVRVLDIHQQVGRHEPAAVREQRVEARHLQRRRQQVALADRELDRVARLPELVDPPAARVGRLGEALLAPLPGRDEARLLGADVELRLRAEAEQARPLLERLAAVPGQLVEHVAQLVEIGVARVRHRRRQVHRLVDVGVPVVEDLIAAVVG